MSNDGAHGFPSLRKSTDEPFPVKVIIRKHRLKKDIGKCLIMYEIKNQYLNRKHLGKLRQNTQPHGIAALSNLAGFQRRLDI